MDYKIRILPRAKLEINDAFKWYSSRNLKPGKELLKEINLIYDLLLFDPFLFKKNEQNYREVPLRKFPFLIIYRIFKDEVLIQSVFHTHQNPTKKP
ncbi:type II toxin-antitoxin system RelE/ParE family toxin [Salegentibacter salegens]|uniref:ParE toxin of type II toxin-antitoxin system, parDE n=1 Tax=Salegentibacter salegens TaxID=143223 RepID=A0A1M7MKL9_9FLAO|nr:type II toxin-antitoxin system RelE/ParE family toxin [Salegentibacter salegens]PRX48180.1 ParE-like toxin of type II ParDE toxin-antitoxin system [Salegentibacter salegens]SHM91471.1 ParE toxin of type II toxin-antitoxin system, parDE [Salegentibacter salegens]